MSPAERSLRARTAVHTSWANTTDRRKRTSNGTAAFLARFERQVDPNNELDPDERARRAESLKKAYMSGLALKAAKSKRAKRAKRAA